MGTFSIKDLEQLSGIKAHTLRIWEQRYELLKPSRTATNIRTYCDEDLKYILKIALLNKNGFKISKIAAMSDAEVNDRFSCLNDSSCQHEMFISLLTTAMIEIDENQFGKIMSNCIIQFGFEHTMIEIIYPFLEKIGVLWLSGSINPAQEHFMTNLIRRKLMVAIDGQSNQVSESGNHFMLFLPEGELHELGLLFAEFLLRKRGQKVTSLGMSVPLKDVISVAKLKKPDYVFTIMTSHPKNRKLKTFLEQLNEHVPAKGIMITGPQAQRARNLSNDLPNITFLSRVEDLFKTKALVNSNSMPRRYQHN